MFCHSALGHKPDSKTFEYNDNALHSAMKSGNLIMKESQKTLSCDLKGTERDAVGLPYALNDRGDWTATNFDCSMSMDDLKNENQDEVGDFVASPIHSSRESGRFDKDADIVMDKSIMECELPELTACYKESTYHVVKDICIDEGVPSQEKILFESGIDEKTLCILLPTVKDQNKELVKEKEDINMSIPDGLTFSAENDSNEDSSNQCDPKDLMMTGEDSTDSIVNDVSKEIFLPGNKLPNGLKFSAENDSNEDSANQCDPKDLMMTGEDSTHRIVNGVSKEIFLPGNKLPMLETGTHTSHYKSSNNDEVELRPFQVFIS